MSETEMLCEYVVTRCAACKVQADWDQRDRLSWGWFHGKPGSDCPHGQYLSPDDVEQITVTAGLSAELLSPSASGPERERGGVSVAAGGTPSPNLRTDRDTMHPPVTDRFHSEPPARPPVTAGTHEPEGVSSDAVAAVPAVRDTETATADRDRVKHHPKVAWFDSAAQAQRDYVKEVQRIARLARWQRLDR